jgi:hypothetical protein
MPYQAYIKVPILACDRNIINVAKQWFCNLLLSSAAYTIPKLWSKLKCFGFSNKLLQNKVVFLLAKILLHRMCYELSQSGRLVGVKAASQPVRLVVLNTKIQS